MSSHDSHHDTPWHQSVHAPGADKRGSSARAAQAERLRQAHVAVHLQKHLKQLKQEVEEEEALSQGPPAPSAAHPSASQPTTGGSAHAGAAATVLQQVKEAARSAPGVSQAIAQRKQDEQMLKSMFEAVWPDLGSFKAWGSATKVASMSGSLTLSLAFFAGVYYLSTTYDRAGQPAPGAGKDATERRGAGGGGAG